MTALNATYFQDADKAREYLEASRWPNGPVCPHCGGTERNSKLQGKGHRPGLHFCGDCREQFTVTVGTVFERSKIKLNVWLQAAFLLCSSKKGMSAHQLHRTLGVTYKTAWFMAHRIREAMKSDGGLMGGGGSIVEADESSQTKCNYMVLGAVITTNDNHNILNESFQKVREKHGMFSEFKWQKVSRAKINAYKDFASVLITATRKKSAHFHCLVVETSKIRNHTFNKGDRDLGLSKFFYQLLIKLGRIYGGKGPMEILMDNRISTTSTDDLRSILNNGLRRRWKIQARPYKTVEFAESHDHDFIQAVDLFIGAIAHFRNATAGASGSSPHKQELARHILDGSALPDFTNDSPAGFREFTLWNFMFPVVATPTRKPQRTEEV